MFILGMITIYFLINLVTLAMVIMRDGKKLHLFETSVIVKQIVSIIFFGVFLLIAEAMD